MLAPETGIEPVTNRLTGDCSTAELLRNIFSKSNIAKCNIFIVMLQFGLERPLMIEEICRKIVRGEGVRMVIVDQTEKAALGVRDAIRLLGCDLNYSVTAKRNGTFECVIRISPIHQERRQSACDVIRTISHLITSL